MLLVNLPPGLTQALRLAHPSMELHVARECAHLKEQTGIYDAVVWALEADTRPDLPEALQTLSPRLSSEGYFFVLLNAPEDDAIIPAIQAAGWRLYTRWDGLESAGSFILFMRTGYDPVAHARRFFDARRPDWSCKILDEVPDSLLTDRERIIEVRLEHLLSLLSWAKSFPEQVLEFFTKAQHLFNELVSIAPWLDYPYQCQAEFWRLAGNDVMAARLLRSIQYIAPSENLHRQLATIHIAHQADTPEIIPPEYNPAISPRRVLFLIHPRAHYGLDVLFDGLCKTLGPDNTIDYPYKPSLHGGPLPEYLGHYPCAFEHPGVPYTIDEIEDGLKRGHFDLVLFGDSENALDPAMLKRLSQSAPDIPWFIIDAIDECYSTRHAVEALTGRTAAGYFKREMLLGAKYGPDTYPLPFAYPEDRIPPPSTAPRPRDLFWAGHRKSGLRKLYLEHLEAHFGMPLNTQFDQTAYAAAMRESRIGLNCFGFGFDTVRYWELPAHGCLLFSERPPISIPYNFRDAETAVFFDDLPDLDRKMRHYLAEPEETAKMAAAGYLHLTRRHSSPARARQLLAWIQERLSRPSM